MTHAVPVSTLSQPPSSLLTQQLRSSSLPPFSAASLPLTASSSPSSSSSSSSSSSDYPSTLSKLEPLSLPSLTLPPSPLHAAGTSSASVLSASSAPAAVSGQLPSHSAELTPHGHSPRLFSGWEAHSSSASSQLSSASPFGASATVSLHLQPQLSHSHSQPLPHFPLLAPHARAGPGGVPQLPPPPPLPHPPQVPAVSFPYPPSAPLLSPYRPMQQPPPYPAPTSSSSHPSTPAMPYHYLQQPSAQHGQHPQGPAPPPPTPPSRYQPQPSSVHQASAGYSGFYAHPPGFGQSMPMLSQNYLQPQQQPTHAQQQPHHSQQQQQQHTTQQPHPQSLLKQQPQQQPPLQGSQAPFSPGALQRLLNPHSAPHLAAPPSMSLGPSFSSASSSSGSATLSSDLLYVNQRYHDLLYKLQLHMRKLDELHHHQHPVLIEDILRALRDELNIYNTQQLHRLSAIKPEHLLTSPLSSSFNSLSSVSPSYLSSASAQPSDRLFCKPSRLISQFNKKPFKLLMVQIQRQYTSSKKELDVMREKDKEKLIAIRVRLMGAPLRGHVYFVAKDLCQLIHSRKGNVAKSVSQFNEHEKARMPVLCPRSNGTLSTHSLTVLTIDGIKRLLTASRSPLAPHLLKWLLGQVEVIIEQGERGDDKVGQTTTVTFPRVERKGEVQVREGEVEQEVQVLLDSDEEGGEDEAGGGGDAPDEEGHGAE